LLKYRGISLPSSSTKETKKEVLLNWERNKNFPERELSLYRIATDLNLVNYGSLYKSNVPVSGTLLISPELQPAYIEERLQNNTFSKKTVTYSKVDDVLGVSVVNGLVTGDVISAIVPHYSVSGTTLIPSNTIEETIYLSFYDKLTITNVINLSRNRLITNNRPSILLMDIFNSLNFLKGYTYGKALWASAILDVKQESSLSLNFED
jgi:hypothetical protein